MRRPVLLLLAVLSLVLGACGSDDNTSASGGATATTQSPGGADTTTQAGDTGCKTVAAPKPKPDGNEKKPKFELASGTTYELVFTTSCGSFTIELDPKNSPVTGGSVWTLAKNGFFDGLIFHRVAQGFVVQAGDPKGDGTGGPGYHVVEAPPESAKYTRGVVAMAKTETEDPGTSGSQFFVVTAEDAGLPADYAILGKVTAGMDTIDRIAALPTDPPGDGAPTQPVVIEKVEPKQS
jgi:cyclophilin family peptidyl-prolyl cis-trans isomerase